MPFDGSGTFNRVMNWVNDAAAGIKIKADRHDNEDDNFAAGLSNTLTKDGQSQPTANIPMNGKKLVNLGAPTVGTDAATKTYVDTADALAAPKASPTFTGKVTLPTGVAGSAPANLPVPTANPTAPVTGDFWPDVATGKWKYKLVSTTLTFPALEQTSTWSAQQTFGSVTGNSGIGTATSGLGEIMVIGNGTGAAMMVFHRPGAYAAYLGLDTDNKWKVGGWSAGANAYEILHMGNYTSLLDARYLENSADNLSIGAAGFAMAAWTNDGNRSGTIYTPTAAGGNIRAATNNGAFTMSADLDGSKAYTLIVFITNAAAGAGAITLTNWSWITGDSFNTTANAIFLCTIVHMGGYRHLNIQAM
jgi:hypothetical protein